VHRSGGRQYSPDAVSLMTLHGAKGLEFPVVFLCGLNEGLIPFKARDGMQDIDEEKRLFYVGVTRARDELVMLTSDTPSPFLNALPQGAIVRGNAFERKPEPTSVQLSLFDRS